MKLVQKRSKKAGLSPGTLIHIGEHKDAPVRIIVCVYGDGLCVERIVTRPEDLHVLDDASVTWVDVVGIHQVDLLAAIGKQFNLHPLLLEDIANTDQRPKLDEYETCRFLVMKILTATDRGDILVEQISLVLGRNYVLSFQENGTDVFRSVRDHLRGGRGRLRQSGADYLLHALVDAAVDQYFSVLELLGEKIESLQERVMADPKPAR